MPPRVDSSATAGDSRRRIEQEAEIDNLLEDLDEAVDPIIRQFAEKMVREAAALAASSGRFTAAEIITQAGFLQPGTLGRIKKHRKVSAWDICLREERKNVAPEMLKPKAGAGSKGRPGVNGDFFKHCQDVYSNPEKKAEYSRMAIEENAQPAEAALVALPKKQKKVLDDLKAHVCTV
jgi:hypothetical protein